MYDSDCFYYTCIYHFNFHHKQCTLIAWLQGENGQIIVPRYGKRPGPTVIKYQNKFQLNYLSENGGAENILSYVSYYILSLRLFLNLRIFSAVLKLRYLNWEFSWDYSEVIRMMVLPETLLPKVVGALIF
jgi:hypothetical protein